MNAPLYTTRSCGWLHRWANRASGARGRPGGAPLADLREHGRVAVQLDDAHRIRFVSQTVQACAFGQASPLCLNATPAPDHAEVAEALVALSRWLAGQQAESGDCRGLPRLRPRARARPATARSSSRSAPARRVDASNGSTQPIVAGGLLRDAALMLGFAWSS